MFKSWYKYRHDKISNVNQIVDYYYIYFCVPNFLRNGIIKDKQITEHWMRLAISFIKISGQRSPKIMHISLPFGIWYGSDSWHRTPAA